MPTDGSNDRAIGTETGPSDQERLDELRSFVEEWDFAARSDSENIRFAFHVVRLVADTNCYGTRMYLFSKEFEGDELPTLLQLLITHIWKDERFLTDDNKVLVERCDSLEVVGATIPGWDELRQGRSFEEAVQAIQADPEILAGITPTRTYVDPTVKVTFEPKFTHGWGLEFVLTEEDIKVRVYGERGKTASAADFLLTYHNRPRVLAELTSRLALLAIGHNDYLETGGLDPDLLARRLFGEAVLPLEDSEVRSAGGLLELAAEQLAEMQPPEGPASPENENDS